MTGSLWWPVLISGLWLAFIGAPIAIWMLRYVAFNLEPIAHQPAHSPQLSLALIEKQAPIFIRA